MKFIGRMQGAAVTAAVVVGLVGLGATSAQAATEDDVASWIANAALTHLGVDVQDPGLADALTSAVRDAVDAGLISVTVGDLADQAADDPDAVDDDELGDAIDDELDEQTGQWEDIAAAWHEAFDQIKADFAECREAATGGADECAHEFVYAMQVNHVAAWQARQEAKLGDISALPADEQEAALEKLQRKLDKAQERLDRAAAHLERHNGSADDSDEAGTEDEVDSFDYLNSPDDTKAKKDKKAKKAKTNKGHGQGNHGNSGK